MILYSPGGHTVLYGSDRPPTDIKNRRNDVMVGLLPLSTFSCAPIPKERPNPNGWVVGPEGLLFWVPEDCRYGLTHLPIMTIANTRRDRGVRIDFTNFRYGTSWTDIYERSAVEEKADVV
jgi:hypothetical protein